MILQKLLGKLNSYLEPEEEYEINGFFGNVVFTCGVTKQGDNIRIYYGVSDTSMAVAGLS